MIRSKLVLTVVAAGFAVAVLGACGGGGDDNDAAAGDERQRATAACEAVAAELGSNATLRSASPTSVLKVRATSQLAGADAANPWAAAEGDMFLATCVWTVEPPSNLGAFTCDQVQSTAYSITDEDGLVAPDSGQCAIAKRAGPEG